jgi:hypothetical protein
LKVHGIGYMLLQIQKKIVLGLVDGINKFVIAQRVVGLHVLLKELALINGQTPMGYMFSLML